MVIIFLYRNRSYLLSYPPAEDKICNKWKLGGVQLAWHQLLRPKKKKRKSWKDNFWIFSLLKKLVQNRLLIWRAQKKKDFFDESTAMAKSCCQQYNGKFCCKSTPGCSEWATERCVVKNTSSCPRPAHAPEDWLSNTLEQSE